MSSDSHGLTGGPRVITARGQYWGHNPPLIEERRSREGRLICVATHRILRPLIQFDNGTLTTIDTLVYEVGVN